MKLILCIDKGGGLSFNNRRQSRDREVIKRIESLFEGKEITANSYSKTVLDNIKNQVRYVDNHNDVTEGVLFAERNISLDFDKVESVYLFVWDKHYPADVVFDENLLNPFVLTEEETFTGFSHEEITLKFYKRRK